MKKENGKTIILIEKLKEIYSLMCESHLKELDIKLENCNLKIKRFSFELYDIDNISNQQKREDHKQIKEQQVSENITTNTTTTTAEEIVSPLNGVFYRSPSPGAAPFVQEGDVVSAGSVLCIIEAMKVMNEIKADKNYKILKVLCENGSPVSVGTKLFLVESV